MSLYETLAFTIQNVKSLYKNLEQTWNKEFELLDESYFVSDIQDYFEYILKKHGTVTDNSSVRIHTNKAEIGLYLKLRQDIIMNF